MRSFYHLLQNRGLAQDTLASALHISTDTLSDWEKGVTEPTYNKLIALAKILGVSEEYLLGDTNNVASRIKCLRTLRLANRNIFAKEMGVEETLITGLESGREQISEELATMIAQKCRVPVDFVLGKPFIVKKSVNNWPKDFVEDMKKSPASTRDYFLLKYGEIVFQEAHRIEITKEDFVSVLDTPISEGRERVIIRGRNGEFDYADFALEQVKLIRSMIAAQKEENK